VTERYCRDVAYLTSDQDPVLTPPLGMWQVAPSEATNFITKCLQKAGAKSEQAATQAAMMITADQRGQYSYGSGLLDSCVCGLMAKAIDGKSEPKIIKEETRGTAVVDGNSGLGAYVASFCMNVAIEKAETAGIGCVVCHNSNHFGIAGYYSLLAARRGFIGLAMSNALPSVCPTRATKPTLGSNPISCAAMGMKSEFVLDMGTATAVRGKVQEQARKGATVPEGWGVDENGLKTNKPRDILLSGGLMPLGGSELHSGYKGYCLGMMAEILCSCLAGGQLSSEMPVWRDQPPQNKSDISQCFIALDPKRFNPNFAGGLQELLDKMHNLPTSGNSPVLVAGDPEAANAEKQGQIIFYETRIIEIFRKLGIRLKVQLPRLAK